MCIIPKNYFVSGHDVLYTKMRHSCRQAVGRGSINEEGQRNTNDVDTEEIPKRWLKVMV